MTANEYAQRIRATWERLRAQEPVPDQEWFANLGEQIEEEIALRAQQMADQQIPETDYLQEVRRLQGLRAEAEHQVMREWLEELFPPHLQQPDL